MIEFGSVIAGAVLLLLLMVATLRGWLASRSLELGRAACEEDASEQCPEEVVDRVFSRTDWEFVRGLKAQGIERLFQRERKTIALVWVGQTSALIQRVIGEHARAARQSKDLKISTEINIVAQFVVLMAVCGILSAVIQIAGPMSLGGLAHFAQKLSQRVSRLQESFHAGVLANAGETEST